MLAFTASQLRAVWAAADRVPFEKRGVFVERVIARPQLQRAFTDADLDDAVRAALTIGGLIPQPLPANLVSRAAPLSCSVT